VVRRPVAAGGARGVTPLWSFCAQNDARGRTIRLNVTKGSEDMGTRTFCCVVAVCAALLGCQSVSPRGDALITVDSRVKQINCKGSNRCAVSVWVEPCPTPTLNKCLAVDKNFTVVLAGVKPDMEWELTDEKAPVNPTPKHFEFDPAKGIEIVDPVPPPGEFENCRTQASGRRFVCKNNHTNKDTNGDPVVYKYKVNVINTSASGFPTIVPLDPWIINN